MTNGIAHMVLAVQLESAAQSPGLGDLSLGRIRYDSTLAHHRAGNSSKVLFLASGLGSVASFVVIGPSYIVAAVEMTWFGHQCTIAKLLGLENDLT